MRTRNAMTRTSLRRSVTWRAMLGCAAAGLLLSGCTRDHKKVQWISMWNDSRVKPLEASPFFANGSSSQAPVAGTVARGQLQDNDALYTGRSGGKLVATFPIPITEDVLKRGQERYNIYCAPCHGRDGRADGMIVRRGFTPPPDYRIARLRNAPAGHFYDVITNGYGVMFSYASRVKPNDRWAIAAYIRVLQGSQPGAPPDVRRRPGLGDEEFPAEIKKATETGTSKEH